MPPRSSCAGCVMPARPASGSPPSTAPATTTSTNRSSSPACPSAPAKTPSTPPAASTSTTPPPGPDPRRTYGRDHLGLSQQRAEHVFARGAGFGLDAQLVHDGQVVDDIVGLV